MKLNKEQIAYVEENLGKTILPLNIVENEDLIGTNSLEILFFWRRGSTHQEGIDSIFKAMDHYNLFSSRLIMIGDNQYALQYCTDGARIHTMRNLDVPHDSIDIEDVRKMLVDVKTLPGEPLYALTLIRTTDGAFVGIRSSHAAGDAFSAIFLCYIWKCAIEGTDFPPPSTQRLFKGKPVFFNKVDKVFSPPLSELGETIQKRLKLGALKTYSKNEYFTDEFFKEIKNQAKAENEKYIISNHQIMTSFLLKKYNDSLLPKTEKIVLRTPINLRDIYSDLHPMYMGNAYFASLTEFTKDEINKMSIPQIAYRLTEAVNKAKDKENVKKVMYLSEYGIEFKPEVFKNYIPFNVETDISATNLTQLSDPASVGLDNSLVNILYMGSPALNCFIFLNQKNTLFAQVNSLNPLP
ncbi:MAG: hypothetical protein JW976_07345 [Syntrophaceae bacterium]|nr:hypothetical protein [Syntrophaceae bacterium]